MSGIPKSLENALDAFNLVHNGGSILGNAVDPGNALGLNKHAYANGGSIFAQGVAPPVVGAPIIPGQLGASPAAQASGTQAPFMPYPSMTPGANPQGAPTMSGYGFNYYGGQAPTPEGGYFNQMAQAMAGPSYAPPGSTWNVMPGPQTYPWAQGSSPAVATGPSSQMAPVSNVPNLAPPPQRVGPVNNAPTMGALPPAMQAALLQMDPTTGLPLALARNPKLAALQGVVPMAGTGYRLPPGYMT